MCSTLFCTFVCHCLGRLQGETSRNFVVTRFMEKVSYVFSFTFFHCRSVSPCIGGRYHFSFSHRRYKIFMLSFEQKNVSFNFYISLWISVALFLVELCWPTAYFSLFFCLSLALYSKFVGMTTNLSLIL